MKLTSLLPVLLVFACAVASAPADEPAPAPAGPPPPKEHKAPETELEGKMEKMNGAFRKLRRQAADPAKNADSIAQVAIMHECAEASAKLVPARAATIPEADRQQWVAGFRSKIADLLKKIDELDAALKAGRNEDAARLVEELGAMQKAGHKDYRTKDK